MNNGVAYSFRETLPQIVVGSVLGAVPGALVGAALPAVIGFALLGILTPHRITAYFTGYLFVVLLGGLLGALVGGSSGACRRLEAGCPAVKAQQVRMAALAGALLAIPTVGLMWTVARWLAQLFF